MTAGDHVAALDAEASARRHVDAEVGSLVAMMGRVDDDTVRDRAAWIGTQLTDLELVELLLLAALVVAELGERNRKGGR
jgi:hypothetical protein